MIVDTFTLCQARVSFAADDPYCSAEFNCQLPQGHQHNHLCVDTSLQHIQVKVTWPQNNTHENDNQ